MLQRSSSHAVALRPAIRAGRIGAASSLRDATQRHLLGQWRSSGKALQLLCVRAASDVVSDCKCSSSARIREEGVISLITDDISSLSADRFTTETELYRAPYSQNKIRSDRIRK